MVAARPFLAGQDARPAATPANPTPIYDWRAQRLRDLRHHIEQHLSLLREYEEALRVEDNPRRLLGIRREIAREKKSLEDYEKQAAELGAWTEQPAAGEPAGEANAVREDLATMGQKLDALSQQLSGAEERLAAGQEAIRAELAQQRAAILAHIDARQQATVAAVIERLDAKQLEVVELLLDAADQRQIAGWQAQELTLLAQQAVVELRHLREGQPDAGQWDSLLNALQQETAFTQRFLLTIPIVPGVLAYESEVNVEALSALKAAWTRLRAKIGR
jgi:hypothetical protein